MNNAVKNFLVIFLVATIWIALEAVNRGYFDFLKVTEFVYFVYWLSGLRLVAIILFGWIGFWGIFLGYVIGAIFLRGFSEMDALFLGFLSSLAPIIAYRFWQTIIHKDNNFDDVKFIQLCYLVFFHSFLTALLRNLYFYSTNRLYSFDQVTMTFTANVLGTFIFLYFLMFCNFIYNKLFYK